MGGDRRGSYPLSKEGKMTRRRRGSMNRKEGTALGKKLLGMWATQGAAQLWGGPKKPEN